MNEKRDALTSVMDKLAKLFPLLASDKAGEVTNAAGRIGQLLAKAKLDWHDLVELLRQDPERVRMRNSRPFETDQEVLVRLAATGIYFLNSEREVFADIVVNGHRETLPLASPQYSEWLMQAFWAEKETIPADAQIKKTVRLSKARALFSASQRHEVHLRVAEFEGKIFLDLGDESWRTVEISTQGWRIVDTPPVRFRRPSGMLPLPVPVRGGKIDELRSFTNLSDADFTLIVAFALDTLRVGRPHPILYLAGEEGAAKSTITEILGRLFDPHRVKVRDLPGVRDLFVASNRQSLLCFDNVSMIPSVVSDALCQISSGSGFAKRKNYTDGEEFHVTGSHPIVITGIGNCIERADLADRTIIITVPRLDSSRRRLETEFWAAFEAVRPRILGALLDIAVHGLANHTTVKTPNLARVADFQRWAMACETAFCAPGAFERAFASNRSEAVETLIDNDPVAKAIGSFMIGRSNWEGTAAQLLAELTDHDQTEARVARSSNWPRDPARLSKALRMMQATLAKADIDVEFGKAGDRRRTRLITLRNQAERKANKARRSSNDNGRIAN